MTSTAWTPPDPSEILYSAVDDTRKGSYEQALTKFLWFHNNALRYQRSQAGVRLSFALSYWLKLADVYPHARVAYIQTRDETEAAFRNDLTNFHLFCDLSSLNERIGEGLRTADLFAVAAQKDPIAARRLYRIAERYLVAAGRFQECGPFLDTHRRIAEAARRHHQDKQWEEMEERSHRPKLARHFYIKDVATLLALLVLNHRPEDARRASVEALEVLNDEEFRSIVDAALTGHLPESSWEHYRRTKQ